MFDKLAEKMRAKGRLEEAEIEFKNFDKPAEPVQEKPKPAPQPAPQEDSSTMEGGNIELKVVRPESFDEVATIADYLIEGSTVVLNMELVDRATTIRMLDFLNGVTYTMEGEIKNVAPGTYIITPNGIDIHD